jgi:hypothetical protein
MFLKVRYHLPNQVKADFQHVAKTTICYCFAFSSFNKKKQALSMESKHVQEGTNRLHESGMSQETQCQSFKISLSY